MFNTAATDPAVVRAVIRGYRFLLFFLPQAFKRDFGMHIAQVFRDACLVAYHRSGPRGLAQVYILALFDWFKIMIEERLNRRTEMTRSKFIRLSGWAFVAAALAFLFTLSSETDLQTGVFRLLGAPATVAGMNRIQTVTEFVSGSTFFFAVLLITIGLVGLWLRYGANAGLVGVAALRIGVFAGAAAAAYVGGGLFDLDVYIPLRNVLVGAMFTGMFVFGLAALNRKLMPRWNVLPALAAVWWPLLVIDAYFVPLGIERLGPSVPAWFTTAIFLCISIPMATLGVVLQADAPVGPEGA